MNVSVPFALNKLSTAYTVMNVINYKDETVSASHAGNIKTAPRAYTDAEEAVANQNLISDTIVNTFGLNIDIAGLSETVYSKGNKQHYFNNTIIFMNRLDYLS